jgi:hypothetical protein
VVSRAALAVYAGEYYSEELDARYRVTASNSVISFQIGTSDPWEARPIFPDAFIGGGEDYTIQFSRTGSQVTGFEVANYRMRHVTFVRVTTRR